MIRTARSLLVSMISIAACGSDDASVDTDVGTSGSTGDPSTGPAPTTDPATSAPTDPTDATDPSVTGVDASSDTGPGSTGGDDGSSEGGDSTTGEPVTSNASDWIIAHFAELDAPIVSGDFDERTYVETPVLVMDATGTNAKYAFDVREEEAPVLAEVGFVDVSVADLVSPDAYGASISTAYAQDAIAYLDEVHLEPNWPAWESYATTNYDGIVLDESIEFYAEDLTIVNWNADTAIDIKAPIAQFVRLETQGGGNRGLRFWGEGPYYLVESSVNNPDGTVLWLSDCTTVTLNIFASTFNGEDAPTAEMIDCDEGDAPNIVVLDVDPRTTGEMHPMFSPL